MSVTLSAQEVEMLTSERKSEVMMSFMGEYVMVMSQGKEARRRLVE